MAFKRGRRFLGRRRVKRFGRKVFGSRKTRFMRKMAGSLSKVPYGRGFRGGTFRGKGSNEVKAIDLAQANYSIDGSHSGGMTASSITLLNGIAVGANYYNRVGRKVTMKYIQLKGFITPPEVTTSPTACNSQYGRLVIVYDKQCNGIAPTWGNVIQSITAAGSTANNPQDPLNLDNRDRFIVIMDKQFHLPGIANIASAGTTAVTNTAPYPTAPYPVNFFKRLNLEVQWKGDTSAVGDISTGSLYMLWNGTSTVASNHLFIGSIRIRFTDC